MITQKTATDVNTTQSVTFWRQRGVRQPRRLPARPAGTRTTTIGFIRGSGMPVSSRTSWTIDSQIQWQSTVNAKAERAEQIEPIHPVVFNFTDLCHTGTSGFSPGLRADASLDLPGTDAAGFWHTPCLAAVKLAVGPPHQFVMTRSPLKLHIGSLLGGLTLPRGQFLLPRRQFSTTCP